MAVEIFCESPEYTKKKGVLVMLDGNSISEVKVFTSTLPVGTVYKGFKEPYHFSKSDPRYVIDATITAEEKAVLLKAVVGFNGAMKTTGSEIRVSNNFLNSDNLQVALQAGGEFYVCTLRPPKTSTVEPLWQSRKWGLV